MKETERIAELLRRCFQGPCWHGLSPREVLGDVTASMAAARPIAGIQTIWEVVLHMNVYERRLIAALAGEALPRESYHKPWPEVPDAGEAAWEKTLKEMREIEDQGCDAVMALDDARLDDPVPNRDYPVRFMLYGMIEHTAYHTGQIAMLKKAQAGGGN